MTTASEVAFKPSERALDSLVALGGPQAERPRNWLDLICAAERIRSRLVELGWEHLAVFCDDRFFLLAGLLALWGDDRTAVLPANGRPETIRALIQTGGADGLLHDRANFEGVPGLNIAPLCAAAPQENLDSDARLRLNRVLDRRDDQPLVTIYSSGSTGAPTASKKTAGQLFGEARALVSTFDLRTSTRVLATAPPHHIYGLLFGVLVPVFAGGTFLRQTPLHAKAIARLVADHDVNVLCAVPPHVDSLQVLARDSLDGIKRVFCSGASLASGVAALLHDRFGLEITEVLGSSETGGIAWRRATHESDWQPLPGVKVAADVDGILLLDSPFANPALPRPQRCADRVEMTTNGRFRYLGRSDGIIKIAGQRVSLIEIEQRLLSVDGVSDAAVLALEDPGLRQHEICAAVVAPGLSVPDLRRVLSRWFDPVALPRRFKLVDRLPREDTGKLQRSRLTALFDAEPATTDCGDSCG